MYIHCNKYWNVDPKESLIIATLLSGLRRRFDDFTMLLGRFERHVNTGSTSRQRVKPRKNHITNKYLKYNQTNTKNNLQIEIENLKELPRS